MKAVGMLQAGTRQRTVAVALGTTQSVISRLWTLGSVAERHRGRSHVTTRKQDRYIQNTARQNRTKTAMMLVTKATDFQAC